MERNNHKTLMDSPGKLFELSLWVEEVASALDRIGLPVGKELFSVGAEIRTISKEIGSAYGGIINERTEDSRRSTATMLEAVLAGITISKEEDATDQTKRKAAPLMDTA